ncbi:MAG: hypothetical protein K6L73_02140 [Cellvibrionaceae bacterium]
MSDEYQKLHELLKQVDPDVMRKAKQGATNYSLRGAAEDALEKLRRQLGYDKMDLDSSAEESEKANSQRLLGVGEADKGTRKKALNSYSNTTDINQTSSKGIDEA